MSKNDIHIRKCTGCLEMKKKSALIRIVRGNENIFSIDITGKKAGRGAYICSNSECLEKCVKIRGFERSFKYSVSKQIYIDLKKEIEIDNG